MYCPECGAEYREGFYRCSDCQVPLVSEAPAASRPDQPIEHLELVTLLEIDNPIRLALVESLLDAEGIKYIVQGESPHTLSGIAFLSRRKKAVLQISSKDERRAQELMEALEVSKDSTEAKE